MFRTEPFEALCQHARVEEPWYRGESDDEHESQQSDNKSYNDDNDAADAEHDQAGRDVDESD